MTRRVNTRLTDADVGRLLAHMPEPPPPSADLTDRIVANAIAASATRPRRAPPRVGRRIWWAIAILGAAGAVTAAAANAGRFELARVLQWPQEIVRAAGWAPIIRAGLYSFAVSGGRRRGPKLGYSLRRSRRVRVRFRPTLWTMANGSRRSSGRVRRASPAPTGSRRGRSPASTPRRGSPTGAPQRRSRRRGPTAGSQPRSPIVP